MAHCNIRDPETGLWNCWSTCVDDYLFDEWVTEEKYKAELLLMEVVNMLVTDDADYVADNYPFNLATYSINGDECTVTIKNLHKVDLQESSWYTKKECDETKAFLDRCRKCNHDNCSLCNNGDHFVEG